MECVFFDMATKKGKHNCNTNIKYGPDVTASQILRPLLAKPRENQKPKNLEKTKKPKNQNFSENVWSEAHVWFFLVFLEFFWFFLVMTLKKLKKLKVFFGFLKKLLLEVKPKNQKNSSLFWFFGQMFRRHVKTIHAKNQKRPEFFLVFHKSLTINLSKKPKKPWVFFRFFKVMTKKKTKKLEENQKKTKHEPQTKHSLKSFGFLVFWFSRGFLVFGLPHGFSPKESSNSWLVPLNLEKTKKTKKPKLFRECLVWGSCLVFFGFPRVFFCFFFVHDLEKTKKTQGCFWFFEETLTWSKPKNQKKLRSFLVFWTDV